MYKENISNKFKNRLFSFKEIVIEMTNAYHYFHPNCLFSIKNKNIFCKSQIFL